MSNTSIDFLRATFVRRLVVCDKKLLQCTVLLEIPHENLKKKSQFHSISRPISLTNA